MKTEIRSNGSLEIRLQGESNRAIECLAIAELGTAVTSGQTLNITWKKDENILVISLDTITK